MFPFTPHINTKSPYFRTSNPLTNHRHATLNSICTHVLWRGKKRVSPILETILNFYVKSEAFTTFRNNQGSICYFMDLSLDKHMDQKKRDLYFFEKAIDENKIEIDELNTEMQKSEDLAGMCWLLGYHPKSWFTNNYNLAVCAEQSDSALCNQKWVKSTLTMSNLWNWSKLTTNLRVFGANLSGPNSRLC